MASHNPSNDVAAVRSSTLIDFLPDIPWTRDYSHCLICGKFRCTLFEHRHGRSPFPMVDFSGQHRIDDWCSGCRSAIAHPGDQCNAAHYEVYLRRMQVVQCVDPARTNWLRLVKYGSDTEHEVDVGMCTDEGAGGDEHSERYVQDDHRSDPEDSTVQYPTDGSGETYNSMNTPDIRYPVDDPGYAYHAMNAPDTEMTMTRWGQLHPAAPYRKPRHRIPSGLELTYTTPWCSSCSWFLFREKFESAGYTCIKCMKRAEAANERRVAEREAKVLVA